MGQGRHRKKPNYKKMTARVALGAAVSVGGVAVPLTFAGSANAATVDQWDRIAECESSGLWNRPDGDGGRSSGGLQFQPASWGDALQYLSSHGVDISGYPQGPGHQAYKATKEQQIMAGEALLALQGPGAWTCNAMTGSLLGSSMFKGGPAPFPATSTPPAPTTPTTPPPPATTPTPEPPDAEDGVYVVKKGDYLSKIATLLKIEGGWQKLYEINKSVVGPNPNLIEPDMKLKLPGHEAPAVDPYKSGLPKVDSKSPSAKPLQQELKRIGIIDKSMAEHDNYGPKTQAAVSRFHRAHPEYVSRGKTWQTDGQIGPKGWAHMRSMRTCDGNGASHPAPKPPSAPPATSGYVAPLSGYRVGDNLIVGSGGSMSRSAGGHSGLDLIAPQGTGVVSIAAGKVVSVNGNAGAAYGNHVVIQHADGKYTLYAHLSATTVSTGQSVSAGQQIGNVGSTGNSSGPHLHFEVRTDPSNFSSGIFLNPVTYLLSHGVSL